MEDRIGDIFYILLLIIAGISGLIRSNRKKKAMQEEQQSVYSGYDESPEDDSAEHNPFESIFSQFEKAVYDEKEVVTKFSARPSYEDNEYEPKTSARQTYESLKQNQPEYQSITRDYKSIATEYEALRKENTVKSVRDQQRQSKESLYSTRDEKFASDTADFDRVLEIAPYVSDLLKDADEIKKAVVLSEIIKAKYI